MEVSSDGPSVFAPHPQEVMNAFDTPNVQRAYTLGVDTDTVELSKRSVIVKPIIQYVIHQIKKSQENLRDPDKNHVSWHPQAESGKGWWTATDPRTSLGGSFSFGNTQQESGKGLLLPQYEPDDHISNNNQGGVALNAQAYFDSHGNPPAPQQLFTMENSWTGSSSSSKGGRFPQMNDYSNIGETVPTPFSMQDLRGSYGPPESEKPRMNRPPPTNNNININSDQMNFGNGHQSNPSNEGGATTMERPPMNNNPSSTCSTSWGWGCVQPGDISLGSGGGMSMGGNLNQVVSQTSSSSSSNLNNFNNNQLDSSSSSILTHNFGSNPSIAEAITSLLKTVAQSGGGSRGSFRYPPRQQYGPPGFMPGTPQGPNQMMMMMTATPSSPDSTSTTMATTTTTTTTAPPPPPPTTTTMTSTVLIASTTVGALAEEVVASGDGSASTMQGHYGEDQQIIKSRPRPSSNNNNNKGPQKTRGQGRRANSKGLNAYFRVLVAGGLGQDPSGSNHDEETMNSSQRGNKSRGFSFGFNYPPKRRGLFSRGRHSPRNNHNRGRGMQNNSDQQNNHKMNVEQDVERRVGYYDHTSLAV